MSHQEYLKLSARTSNQEGRPAELYLHGIIGMISEFSEIEMIDSGVNAIEEIGDVLWYLACCQRAIGFSLSPVATDCATLSGSKQSLLMLYHSSTALDTAKRWWMYGKSPAVDVASKQALGIAQCAVNLVMIHAAGSLGLPAQDVIQAARIANIAKLQKRYPEKFTQDRAINRDVASEYKAMAGAESEPSHMVINRELDAKYEAIADNLNEQT